MADEEQHSINTEATVSNGDETATTETNAEDNGDDHKEEPVSEDRKLFIGGLSWETREPDLKEYFEKFGTVDAVDLKMNQMTGKSRCFAFVIFKSSEDVDKVCAAGEHAINSKKVDVKRAKAKSGKIFIGGLKPELTDDMIREYFSQFGKITEFEMPVDKITKVRKGFGFITFEREDTVKELINKRRVQIGEHSVDLRRATPKPEKGMASGGWGGGAMGYGGGPTDYYGYGAGGYGGAYDYYGGYGGAGYNYYGGPSMGGWGGAPGGGKIRGGVTRGAKRGGAPY